MNHPGRVKIQLAKMLCERGIEVSPYDFITPQGGQKVYRWSVRGEITKHIPGIDKDHIGNMAIVESWDTMTKCSNGFSMNFDPSYPGWRWEVHAR